MTPQNMQEARDSDYKTACKIVRKMGYDIEKEEGDGGFVKEDLIIIAETFKDLRDKDHKRYKKHLCERFDALMEIDEWLANFTEESRIKGILSGIKKLRRLIERVTTDDQK